MRTVVYEFCIVKNVYKRYQMGEVTITASDGVSFDIEKGEFVVITGASGAGKTTVLNLMGGMDTCDEGEIIIDGKDIAKLKPRELTAYRRYDIGFVSSSTIWCRTLPHMRMWSLRLRPARIRALMRLRC